MRECDALEASKLSREAAAVTLAAERRKTCNRGDKARAYELTERLRELRAKGLSNSSINHTISDLAQVLETAVEYGLLGSNPADGA